MKKPNSHIQLVFWALVLMCAAPSVSATVRATVDTRSVYEGDTLTLTIESDGQHPGIEPDLSPLEADFKALGTRTGTQIQIINGRRSDKTQWVVELEPRRTGTLKLPAIAVGSERTQPIEIRVSVLPATSSGPHQDKVFVEMEAEPKGKGVYVKQQIRLTLRLLYSVPLLEATLTDPNPKHAIVERLGEDRSYKTVRNGRQYRVIERHFAVFPEKSGALSIPPVVFRGRVASTTGGSGARSRSGSLLDRFFNHSPFNDPSFGKDPFTGSLLGDPGKRISRRSDVLSIDVKPQPEAFAGLHWLPSASLNLSDSWVESPPEFKVGEPLTRTLTIEAKGLEASHLPEIASQSAAGMSLYPEQPAQSNRTDGAWVYGKSVQTLAYVPTETGEVTLPAVSVKWWDTTSNEERVASVPAWTVNVLPGAAVAGGSDTRAQRSEENAEPPPAPVLSVTEQAESKYLGEALRGLWPWLIAMLVLLGALGVAFREWRRRSVATKRLESKQVVTTTPEVSGGKSTAQVKRAFRQACQEQDPRVAARTLLQWAEVDWPENPPRSLGALAARLSDGAEQVRALDKRLYSAQDQGAWDGESLWTALRDGLNSEQEKLNRDTSGLAPLYPQR